MNHEYATSSFVLSISKELQQIMGEKDGLDQSIIRTSLTKENADSWDTVLQSLEPQRLLEHTERREDIAKDIGCLLHFVFLACIEGDLRDNRTLSILVYGYDWYYYDQCGSGKAFLDLIIRSSDYQLGCWKDHCVTGRTYNKG